MNTTARHLAFYMNPYTAYRISDLHGFLSQAMSRINDASAGEIGHWREEFADAMKQGKDRFWSVRGVAPEVLGTDVFVHVSCSPVTLQCSTDLEAEGISSAIGQQVRVINLSLSGTDIDMAVSTAVAQAWGAGIVLVASAGNNGGRTVEYPAGYSNVVGVSGIWPNMTFASSSPYACNGGTASSNRGSHVDLAAPFFARSTIGNNMYEDESEGWCGNSMATPFVAGAATLLFAQHPGWSNVDVVNRLVVTAVDGGPDGWDERYGHGIVDAGAAVGIPRPPSLLSASINGPTEVLPEGFCLWSASVSGGSGIYNYEWYRDRELVSTQGLYHANVGVSDFELELYVTDSDGQVAWPMPIQVEIDPQSWACMV